MAKFSPKMWKWPIYGKAEVKAVSEMILRGEVSFSKEPLFLEEEFKQLCGAAHNLSAVNGSASLHMAFFAAGVKPGDRVIAPTYTHWATTAPALHLGARIDFAGFTDATLLPNPNQILDLIVPATRVVIITHLWGNIFPVETIKPVLAEKGIILIEDCSHAHGGCYCDGKKVGSNSAAACFSLQSNKILPAGEGGMLCSSSAEVIECAKTFGLYERLTPSSPYRNTGLGYKYRMNPLNAAIARIGLKNIAQSLKRRKAVFSQLIQAIPKELLRTAENGALYALVLSVKDEKLRRQLFKSADESNIPLGTAQYPLLHQEPFFSGACVARPSDAALLGNYNALVVMPLPLAAEECEINALTEWFHSNLAVS